MALKGSLIDTVLEAARERCEALEKEATRFENRRFPSQGPRILLNLVRRTNDAIKGSLRAIAEDTELRELLTPEQFELKVYRHTEFLPYLHWLLSFLQGAEVYDTPYALIPPLRRFLRKCLADSEVIFSSQHELNYSFFEVAENIRRLYENAGEEKFKELVKEFPSNFIAITFPSVETNHVLLHCMIAHEIGHGIFVRDKLHEKLFPLVRIDHIEITRFARHVTKPEHPKSQLELLPTELQVRQSLTKKINDSIDGWLNELCSDAIGLCLFGPAYYFAFLNFIVSFHYFDKTALTHPAPRLRLRLLSEMIADGDSTETLGYAPYFDDNVSRLYESWKKEASTERELGDPLYRIVSQAVTPLLKMIANTAIESSKELIYKTEQFNKTDELCRLLVNVIPPVELVRTHGAEREITDLVSVLNAGWQVYLSSMEEFAKNLRLDSSKNGPESKERLLQILLKSVELLETITRWKEVQIAIKGTRH